MKNLLNLKTCILLLGVGLFALFGCDAEQVDMKDLVDVQETFNEPTSSSRTLNVLITGTILNPENGQPVARAKVQVGNAVAYSNARGRWGVKLGNTGDRLWVKVTKEDHVDFIFPVSFCDIRDNTSIDWSIDLPPTQPAISFIPGIDGTITYDYKGVTYTVTVPANATNRSTRLTVGPGGTVVGEGISRYFAIVGIDFDDDEQSFTAEETYDFANEVVITYDPLAAAQSGTLLSTLPLADRLSGGIGSINPAVFEDDAPTCFREIAFEWQEAIEEAVEAKESNATADRVSTIFTEELYSEFIEELCGVEFQDVEVPETLLNGTVTVDNTIEGTLHLGIGVITDTEEIFLIDQEGEPREEIMTIQDECRCSCSGDGSGGEIPHQSTADGG